MNDTKIGLSAVDVAQLADMSPPRITQLTKQGRLVRVGDVITYDSVRSYLKDKWSADTVKDALAEAKARKEHYLAEQARIKYELMAGKTIDREAIEVAVIEAIIMAKEAILGVPDSAAQMVTAMDDREEVREYLTEKIHKALRVVSGEALRKRFEDVSEKVLTAEAATTEEPASEDEPKPKRKRGRPRKKA